MKVKGQNRRFVTCLGVLFVCVTALGRGAGKSEVADAAMKGDKVVLRALLLQKVDASAPQVDGATALHWAVYRNDVEMADLLIRAGANVKAANRDGVTPLAMASLYGNSAMVVKLIKAGAEATETGPNGQTVLMLAARNGNPDVIKVLVEGGAKVNARETLRGTTALMWAVDQKHPAAVKALLSAGADVAARSGGAGLPRNYMAGRVNVAQVQAAARRQMAAAAAGRTYEQQLAFEGITGRFGGFGSNLAAGQQPAGAGAPAAAGAAGGTSPAAGQSPATVQPAAVQSPSGQPAAAVQPAATQPSEAGQRAATQPPGAGQPAAANRGRGGRGGAAARRQAGRQAGQAGQPAANGQDDEENTEVVVAGLVGSGGGGLTALVLAAREGDLESAKLLLDAGANVNQVTEYGWTPLLTATNNRHYQLGKLLIERGANVNLANKGAWTPLYLATDNRNIEGGDYPVPKPDLDHLDYITFLLDHGANVNARAKDNTLTRTIFTMQWFQENGATAFVRAAQSSDLELMKLLVARGADPKIATEFGDTALTAAAGIGWVEGVTYEHSVKENLEAVKMLLELGLDPNGANNDGRTPLMGAAMKGRNDVVQLLVDHGAKLDQRDHGSRDTDTTVSVNAGHTWEALDYADGLVRVGVQSAVNRADTAALIRKLMTDRGLPVPPPNRIVESICVVELCQERQPAQAKP